MSTTSSQLSVTGYYSYFIFHHQIENPPGPGIKLSGNKLTFLTPDCVLLLNYLALAELLPESNSYSAPCRLLCHFGGISMGV